MPAAAPTCPAPAAPRARARRRAGAVIAAFAMLIGAALAQVDPMDEGRARSEAFLAGELGPIWEAMTPQMQDHLGDADALAAFREQVRDQIGAEARVRDETVTTDPGGITTYTREAVWSGIDRPMVMTWSFDPQGRIAGFSVRAAPELAESRFLDYRTKADLRLPFDGRWFVFWGGRTLAQNYHAAHPAQRFAYDFLVMQDGQSYEGNAPSGLDSYYCWGQPILAPAPGTVVAAATDRPDNPIGETDAERPFGNHVVLDLGNAEFAVLAHMQEGSVTVRPGDRVERSQHLGLCGNSGNTSEPHLHFHLQTTPELTGGEGLPAQFQTYRADGAPVARGEPVKGETVADES